MLRSELEPVRRLGRRRRGFTIIEILIAIVILVLGITGIVALFPTAINAGNKTVEDTYAATVCQSVVDAVTVGLRESRYTYQITTPITRTWRYFVFDHDGVVDAIPKAPDQFDTGGGDPNGPPWDKDWCIILPRSPNDNNKASAVEPIWIYPVPDADGCPKDQRNPSRLRSSSLCGADNGSSIVDNFHTDYMRELVDGTPQLWIPRVYSLGTYRTPPSDSSISLPGGVSPGDVRLEFLDEKFQADQANRKTIPLDPYPFYSFCFALQRARVDTTGDGRIDQNDLFSDSLYELRVMVFKGFSQDDAKQLSPGAMAGGGGIAVPKGNAPIKTFITLISI